VGMWIFVLSRDRQGQKKGEVERRCRVCCAVRLNRHKCSGEDEGSLEVRSRTPFRIYSLERHVSGAMGDAVEAM
jgi:hypothetical protein